MYKQRRIVIPIRAGVPESMLCQAGWLHPSGYTIIIHENAPNDNHGKLRSAYNNSRYRFAGRYRNGHKTSILCSISYAAYI